MTIFTLVCERREGIENVGECGGNVVGLKIPARRKVLKTEEKALRRGAVPRSNERHDAALYSLFCKENMFGSTAANKTATPK